MTSSLHQNEITATGITVAFVHNDLDMTRIQCDENCSYKNLNNGKSIYGQIAAVPLYVPL